MSADPGPEIGVATALRDGDFERISRKRRQGSRCYPDQILPEIERISKKKKKMERKKKSIEDENTRKRNGTAQQQH